MGLRTNHLDNHQYHQDLQLDILEFFFSKQTHDNGLADAVCNIQAFYCLILTGIYIQPQILLLYVYTSKYNRDLLSFRQIFPGLFSKNASVRQYRNIWDQIYGGSPPCLEGYSHSSGKSGPSLPPITQSQGGGTPSRLHPHPSNFPCNSRLKTSFLPNCQTGGVPHPPL